jgi:hypothetical protein
MKAKETRSNAFKKFIYYLDEGIVFLITVVAIIFSDTIQLILKGQTPAHGAFFASWTKIAVSAFIAVMLYGSVNNTWKFNDRDKPPLIKRVYTSVMMGLAWKSLIGSIAVLN